MEMKAVTLKQPYASMMFHGKLETRTWYTSYRGAVAIHASKRSFSHHLLTTIANEDQIEEMAEMLDHFRNLPKGVILGVGELVNCRKMEPKDLLKAYVRFNPNMWIWEFENLYKLEVPIEMEGRLGLYDLPFPL